MQILRRGVPVALSPLEYRLLAYLIHQRGRIVSPGELIEHLYGDGNAREANALEAVITRLRRKLGADAIETRRGFGYVLPGDEA
jgi:DNA-binding response OmpR family regulator